MDALQPKLGKYGIVWDVAFHVGKLTTSISGCDSHDALVLEKILTLVSMQPNPKPQNSLIAPILNHKMGAHP